MVKNVILGPNLACLAQIWTPSPQFFFVGFIFTGS